MVTTERVGMPSWTTECSCSADVGQACTQAPHETHSELRKSVPPALILRVEAAALDGEREGALDVGAGAHAARADDAGGGVEGEVGVGLVDRLRVGDLVAGPGRP